MVAVAATGHRPVPGVVRAAAIRLAFADSIDRVPLIRRNAEPRFAGRRGGVLPGGAAAGRVHVRHGDATRGGAVPGGGGRLSPPGRARPVADAARRTAAVRLAGVRAGLRFRPLWRAVSAVCGGGASRRRRDGRPSAGGGDAAINSAVGLRPGGQRGAGEAAGGRRAARAAPKKRRSNRESAEPAPDGGDCGPAAGRLPGGSATGTVWRAPSAASRSWRRGRGFNGL